MIRKILENVFITEKCTKCRTLHTLQIDVFDLPRNKNIEKLFSKYKLLSLDQAKFSSDRSQILILHYPIPRASMPPLQSLLNFPLAN